MVNSSMVKCIYCGEVKKESDFTLEHVIPQFLGGAYGPNYFKIRSVCKTCNSRLGLFVDAAFEKSYIVSNALRYSYYALFDIESDVGLPLVCMGEAVLSPPEMRDDEVCELWTGPLSELVYWIRPKDERLYWYSGGNPISIKKLESRAYFVFSERSKKMPKISWLSFRDAFKDKKRVKKILCTKIIGDPDPEKIGFISPDSLDQKRIDYFLGHLSSNPVRHAQIPINMSFDKRFYSKLALGVGYSLFGEKVLETEYSKNLCRALWYRDGDEIPKVMGVSAFLNVNNDELKQLTGELYAVTLIVSSVSDGIALNLNIGTAVNGTVMCATTESLAQSDMDKVCDGIVIVLYRCLQKCFVMSLSEYLAHKTGNSPHNGIMQISKLLSSRRDYLSGI